VEKEEEDEEEEWQKGREEGEGEDLVALASAAVMSRCSTDLSVPSATSPWATAIAGRRHCHFDKQMTARSQPTVCESLSNDSHGSQ
jgi:hypothetical protein